MNFNAKHIQEAKLGFQNKCITVLIDGYYLMKKKGNCQVDWEEEDITEQLIYFMEGSHFSTKWKIDISPEFRLYSEKSVFENKSAKKSPRIDMRFLGWQKQKKYQYFVEAKNLCETNWTKKNGTIVSASYQQKRFFETGIKHFIAGYYPANGCLCGYVLQGNTEKIIQRINVILSKNSFDSIKRSEPVNGYNYIYELKFKRTVLISILFDLTINGYAQQKT